MATKGKKTGFDSFMEKNFDKSVGVEQSVDETRERHETGVQRTAERRPGRPRKTDKPVQSAIHLVIDSDLKEKLEQVKNLTHRSTLKDIIIEGMYDVIKKYGL